MITKWYEVTCDWCGHGINHYIDKKPSDKMLRKDGCVVKGGNVFCTQQCCDYFYNGKQVANEQEMS